MTSRRRFLQGSLLASGALLQPALQAYGAGRERSASPARPLRILILGGTGYIGPHHVRAAVARGHHVSVFNRGKADADLPKTVERLVGDRNNNLKSIQNRDWDAVLDLATFGPRWVRSLGEALKGRVNHYTFISTISVYGVPAPDDVREGGPMVAYDGQEDPYSLTAPGKYYGALKALCEREAATQFPARTLVLRPGYIVGPGDPNGALTYWPVRMERGGEVLVTGDRSTPVQFIDVRDLAEWVIRLVEQGATSIYNAVGPTSPLSFEEMLQTAQALAPTPPTLTWVPATWLAAQETRDIWNRLLFWTHASGGYAGTMRINNERALAAGFTARPLRVTLADALHAYKHGPAEEQVATHVYRKREDGMGFDSNPVPWDVHLRSEKEVLAAWRSQHRKADDIVTAGKKLL